MQNKRSIGATYEKIAGAYLQGQGYEILAYNFYSRNGEIDIIAKHEGYLVFVEVKYRKNAKFGYPTEAVSLQKQRKISKASLYYIHKYGLENMPIRFDVVSILGNTVSLIQNAFDFQL